MGWRSSVGAPITVDGRLWGALAVISKSEKPLPLHTEQRLAEFTELVATAIANSEAHQELARLADEQAALRRVATLAAQGAAPGEVFEAVSAEVAPLVGADGAGVTRYEADGTFTALGGWTSSGGYPVAGRRFPLEGSVSGLVLETRRASRIDRLRRPARRGSRGHPRDGLALRDGSADLGRRPPLGCAGRLLDERRAATRRYRERAWASSPRSWRPQSRTPRAAPSSTPHARGSSPPPTRRGGESSATCTTAPSSSSSRWRSRCVRRRHPCRRR